VALAATPAAAFPGNGQPRSDLAEISALKKEVPDPGRSVTSSARRQLFCARGDMRFAFIAKHRNVWDNSVMEFLFVGKGRTGRPKGLSHPRRSPADIFGYIERLYNPRRRYSKPGDLSPMEFAARAVLACLAVNDTGSGPG
jgi:putative transposase